MGGNEKPLADIPLVAIHMITCNHKKYIEKAVRSVLEQKVDFKIKLVLTDDASDDGTSEICQGLAKAYPDLFDYVRHNTRMGASVTSAENLLRCFASGAKYCAVLDGDDYWCDMEKLKKQVAILESKPQQFALCFTDVNYVNEEDEVVECNVMAGFYAGKGAATQKDILTYKALSTQTVLFAIDEIDRQLPVNFNKVYNGDSYIFAMLAKNRDAAYLNEVTAHYCMHTGGIMTGLAQEGRIKKTQGSLRYMITRPELKPDTKEGVRKRIVDLQVQVLDILRNGGYVSLYVKEFFVYLFLSASLFEWKQLPYQLRMFFRVTFQYFRLKLLPQ
ncbi:MAG TPA: glycosyltransferase [Chitinophagales bacterium]|nr:glycosyltransferase [Chitinophagales bacterium]